MKISGVYKIESRIKPERCYIGSAKHINRRWGLHLNKLRKNEHHSIILQNHFNKYGESDLRFSILLGCDIIDLIKTEQYFLDSYKPYFNVCRFAGSSLGIKRSAETNKKHSLATKGRKGKPLTPEHIEKLRKSNIGKIIKQETRDKIRKTLTGRKHTKERCENMSKALKGKKPTKGNTGMKHTQEHKDKISNSLKLRHALKEDWYARN
jgi:group I intron endonuclease